MLRDHCNESHLQCSECEMHDFLGRCPRLSMSCAVGALEPEITTYCDEIVWSTP
jgi:hypothetical protein